MTTHVPPQDEQPADATRTGEELQAAMPTSPSVPQPVVLPTQPEEEFFSFEDEQPDLEAAFAAPFQRSNAMPTVYGAPRCQVKNVRVSKRILLS